MIKYFDTTKDGRCYFAYLSYWEPKRPMKERIFLAKVVYDKDNKQSSVIYWILFKEYKENQVSSPISCPAKKAYVKTLEDGYRSLIMQTFKKLENDHD